MKYAIVYSSRTGNTRMLADHLQTLLPKEDCVYFGTPDAAALEARRIYVGFWTDKGTCDDQTKEFLKTLGEQEVFLFGTAGFGISQDYLDQIAQRAAGLLPAGVKQLGAFLCQGKMPMAVREKYEKMKHLPGMKEKMTNLIDNFDAALSHPNEEDLQHLEEAVRA